MTSPDNRLVALAELGGRVATTVDVEGVVDAALLGISELLGLQHALLLVHHPETDRLVTLASRGYDVGGIGSEVAMGQGVIGIAAQRRQPMRIGNLQRMLAYARTVEGVAGDSLPGAEILLPGLPDARSQLAVPMLARGELVGVLAVESERALAYAEDDERTLALVAHLVAASLEREQLLAVEPEPLVPVRVSSPVPPAPASPVPPGGLRLRHYEVDGSTFLDDSYVIKGVAGRLLWKLAGEHVASGRTAFTNREARLDRALGLPAYRDNFESRLILLKRRLQEREAPLQITSTGRGRFELAVTAPLELELVRAQG